jgi:transcriptional regulator with XRE-family HTH domain
VTGEELGRRRSELGLTVNEMRAVFGVHRRTWIFWEAGREPIPRPELLAEALDAVGVFRRQHRLPP